MPSSKFKKKIRARMADTGESYTHALMALRREYEEANRPRIKPQDAAKPAEPTSPFSIEWRAPVS